MNKKVVVKIVNMILIAMVIISISLNCFALTPIEVSGSEDVSGTPQITKLGNDIVGIFQVVGVVLAVVIIIVLGIKYMLGSAEEKSEYKKSMLPYVVGAALIFAGSIFANVIYEFFAGMNG